ncbi:hypothetical protein EMIT0P253_340053 [Pseudomonas sp. IT-P253]
MRKVVPAEDTKIKSSQPSAAATGQRRGVVALLQAKKKALLSKTFLNFGAPRETRTPTPFENGF